ncbi:S26 family signal peptidase [Sphaerimonospora sp. CA-214678]|uniref:S26 family signal peptidase n=1 Tax=Sphaerimonospora sp. CA-214678 TaxID=3240029 RepID=UPI003D92D021
MADWQGPRKIPQQRVYHVDDLPLGDESFRIPLPAEPQSGTAGIYRYQAKLLLIVLLAIGALLTAGACASAYSRQWPITAICAALLAVWSGAGAWYLLRGSRLVAVIIRGRSMEPAYRDGDRVLVYRTGGVPSVGQVVVVERWLHGSQREWNKPAIPARGKTGSITGRSWMVKRVAAVPGDPVPDTLPDLVGCSASGRVPAGMLLLLGDNKDASFDSRKFGYFPLERVLGVVHRSLSPER